MSSSEIGEYNRDQLSGFLAIAKACETLSSNELETLGNGFASYLQFRADLDAFQAAHFTPFCREFCYESKLSACCGFESIFTFFADMAIDFLTSNEEEFRLLLGVLARPNKTGKCVYLGASGCLWKVPPISCAMFLCERSRESVFGARPEAAEIWMELREREKEYTYPVKPVLFDDIEEYFINLGVDSPHMYFHRSPGLLRLKSKASGAGKTNRRS